MKHYIRKQEDKDIRTIAYFSMEIGLKEEIPTYAGGLGVLAGDTLKTFADLVVPVVGITLLSRKGYFHQDIKDGWQHEEGEHWNPANQMNLMQEKVVINLENRDVVVQAWEYRIKGIKGFEVPIYFLDTNLEENHEDDKHITDYLYGGDSRYRIKQEAVLGVAGLRMLEILGYRKINKYHMNEGHSAFLTLELLRENIISTDPIEYDLEKVNNLCVFTTHTPVPAGHDQFTRDDFEDVFGKDYIAHDYMERCYFDNKLNMTLLALMHSAHINGVAVKHTEISKDMFPGYPIDSITNGVHSLTWTSPEFQELYDRVIPSWRHDPFNLRYSLGMSRKDIWDAHVKAKKKLIDHINEKYNKSFEHDVLTIGFARRATPYKRPDLFFKDLNRLREIHDKVGKFQILIAGKAHPKDTGGKDIIKHIHEIIKQLEGHIKVIYLENYNMGMAKILIPGVDLWLNTPRKPREASGTSGMKASHNGIPNFSVLDGWWLEGHIENITGWSIGGKAESSDDQDANDLYVKLAEKIIPMFYNEWDS
jgi:starch phosphorylase